MRSEGDYGPGAEREMAKKRADYFAAGTKVVWDVDLRKRRRRPRLPRRRRRTRRRSTAAARLAEAEPAVPGWTMPVDELFE